MENEEYISQRENESFPSFISLNPHALIAELKLSGLIQNRVRI